MRKALLSLLAICAGFTHLACQSFVDKLNARYASDATSRSVPDGRTATDATTLALNRVHFLWKDGEWREVIRTLSELLETGQPSQEDKRYEQVIETRAWAYFNLDQPQSSASDFTLLLNRKPENVDWLVARARTYLLADEPAKALSDLDRARASGSSDFGIFLYRGRCLELLGKKTEAIESYRAAIAKAPDEPQAYVGLLLVLENAGTDENELLDLADATIRRFPDDDTAYCIKAKVLEAKGDSDGHLATIEAGIRNVGSTPSRCLYFSRALARHLEFENSGNKRALDQAYLDYSVTIGAGGESYASYWNRCLVGFELGYLRAAADDCRHAASLPGSGEQVATMISKIFAKARTDTDFLRAEAQILVSLGYLSESTSDTKNDVEVGIKRAQHAHNLTPTGVLDSEIDRLLVAELVQLGTLERPAASAKLPLRVLFPPGETYETELPAIQLQLLARATSSLEVTLNGKILDGKGLASQPSPGGTLSLTLPLTLGENLIGLLAKTSSGESQATKLVVTRRAGSESNTGTKWAILVGAGTFEDPSISPLPYAGSDAADLAQFLVSRAGFQPENVILLGTEATAPVRGVQYRRATFENVRRTLFGNVIGKLKKEDTLVFYFSGHGMLIPDSIADDGLAAVLAPVDFDAAVPELRGLMLADIKRLAWLPPERVFVILDACFSGEGRGVKSLNSKLALRAKATGASLTGGFADLGTGKGRVLISSSQDNQPSWESKELRHGVFTFFLLQSLQSGERRLANVFKDVHTKVLTETKGLQEPRLDAEEQRGDILIY